MKAERISTIEKLDSIQALQSKAFSLPSTGSSGVQKYFEKYQELLNSKALTASQEIELSTLEKYFSSFDFLPGETELDRRFSWEIYEKVVKALQDEQSNRIQGKANSTSDRHD